MLNVTSPEVATVQFLNRGFQTIYRRPRIDDVADVQNRFVFASDVEVLLGAHIVYRKLDVYSSYMKSMQQNISSKHLHEMKSAHS